MPQDGVATAEVQAEPQSDFDRFAAGIEIEDTTDPSIDAAVEDGQEPDDADIEPSTDEDAGAEPEEGGVEPEQPATAQAPEAPTPAPSPTDAEREAERERTRLLEQQVEQYRHQEEVRQLDNIEQQAQSWYLNQGFTPEQARLAAQQVRQVNELALQQQRQYQLAIRNEQGRYNAAVHYAKQYGLGLDGVDALIKLGTPQEMEREAKHMKEIRELRSELANFKKQRVPAGQPFDNGRSAAAAGNSYEADLDRYIAGARDAKAVAAAKRAAGF